MASHDHSHAIPPDADPRSVEEAFAMWHSFTDLVKKSGIAIAVILVLMAIFLL